MQTSRITFRRVWSIKNIRSRQLLHHSTHGNGQPIPGSVSTSTTQVHFWEKCFSWWWTHIPNALRYKWYLQQHPPIPLPSSSACLLRIASHSLLCLTMSQISPAVNSRSYWNGMEYAMWGQHLPSGIKWVGRVVRTNIPDLAEGEWWGWCTATDNSDSTIREW